MWRVGVDVGGTFTDLFGWEEETGEVRVGKVLTTKDDRSRGVIEAVEAAGIPFADIAYFAHGSTTATNALVERSYPRAAFITTDGFRDTIEIGRVHREHLYDPYQRKPKPLIPRRLRFSVAERIDARGRIIRPLDEDEVAAAARRIAETGAASVAIGFINAYKNPEHERRAREIVRRHLPNASIAISSETRPQVRELGRFVTTIVRAVLLPVMTEYFDRLERTLRERGFRHSLLVLKSNGGVMGLDLAKERPEELIESGPAGGLAYANYLSQSGGLGKVIHTDMGGTTFDASIVEDGHGLITHDYELEWDMPIVVPMLDIRSVGAGGGSIAWIDSGGSLRVGPQSAGAEPGPICYRRGGREVTVTDANLILNRLEPTLGGKFELDRAGAEAGLARLAERLGLDPLRAAEGVIEICCENMAHAIKMVLLDRGRDPRDFALASFGGAGPMHACFIARAMNIPRVVVPAYAGVGSAFGATVIDLRHDLEAFFYAPVRDADLGELNRLYDKLEGEGRALLEREVIERERVTIARSARMRYVGESFEVTTAVMDGPITPASVPQIEEAFHREHEHEYGVFSDGFVPSFVSLGLTAIGHIRSPAIETTGRSNGRDVKKTRRDVYFGGEWLNVGVYDGEALTAGFSLEGPALVEYSHSLAILPPGTTATVDGMSNLIVDVGL